MGLRMAPRAAAAKYDSMYSWELKSRMVGCGPPRQPAGRAGHFTFVGGVQGLSKRRRTIGSNVSMGSLL